MTASQLHNLLERSMNLEPVLSFEFRGYLIRLEFLMAPKPYLTYLESLSNYSPVTLVKTYFRKRKWNSAWS